MSKPKKVTLASGGVRWRIVVDAGRDAATGKRRQLTRTYDRKKDADAELARVQHERNRGIYVMPSTLTLDAMLDGFLKSACFEREEATRSNYVHALRPARERLGGRLVQSIEREDIEALRDFMLTAGRKRGGTPGTGLGARSVRLTLSRLSAAFEAAVDDGKVIRNPCRKVRLPKMARKGKVTWSEDEVGAFLASAAADRLHAAWRMALYGLRREEICGLRWSGIDLQARTLTIATVRVMVDGRVVTKDAPKSERSARTLPLDDDLAAALTALRKAQAAEKLAAGPAYGPGEYVACDEAGEAVSPEWLSDEFERLVKGAGVPRLTLHGCRHTGLSLMEKNGVPISVISLWAGHASPEFTYRVYVHANAGDLTAARDALSRLYKVSEA
ncbi:MAG TPA: site-specific integrase [Streptosporangiaceae bacterium]|nr:site-specific integrase [Streptosporangiaceae bacterium]